jgi:hypothetical protein
MLKSLVPIAIFLVLLGVSSPALAEGTKPSVAKTVGAAAKKAASALLRKDRVNCYSNSDYLIMTKIRDDGSEHILVKKAYSAKKSRCVFSPSTDDWMLEEPGPAELSFVALSGHWLAIKLFNPSDIYLPRVHILDLRTQKVIQEIPDIFEMDISEASEAGFPFWRDTGLKVNRDNCPEYVDQAEDEDSATGVPYVLRKLNFSFASQKVTETSETWCILDVD